MLMTIVECVMVGMGLLLIGVKGASIMIGAQVSGVRAWLGSTRAAQYHDLGTSMCTAQADAWLASRKKKAAKPSPAPVSKPTPAPVV